MNKYIDAEKLIAEITRIYNEHQCHSTERYEDGVDDGYHDCCDEIVAVITSLQQEPPELPPIGSAETYYQKGLHSGIIKGRIEILKGLEEIEKRKAEPVLVINEQEQPEVDIEKEITEHAINMPHGEFTHDSECVEHEEWAKREFRHFYELGLNARKG